MNAPQIETVYKDLRERLTYYLFCYQVINEINKTEEGNLQFLVCQSDKLIKPIEQLCLADETLHGIFLRATPDCKRDDLVDLICKALLASPNVLTLDKQTIEKLRTTKARREWLHEFRENLLSQKIVITQAEYLTTNAIHEVRDLSTRAGFSFLLVSDRPTLEDALVKAEGKGRFTPIFDRDWMDTYILSDDEGEFKEIKLYEDEPSNQSERYFAFTLDDVGLVTVGQSLGMLNPFIAQIPSRDKLVYECPWRDKALDKIKSFREGNDGVSKGIKLLREMITAEAKVLYSTWKEISEMEEDIEPMELELYDEY